jgi:hypothetical protein
MRIARPPKIEKELSEAETGGLTLLGGSTVRGLELTFESGKTNILTSSANEEDAQQYLEQLEAVYGQMAMEPTKEMPTFLSELPRMLGVAS